VVEKGIRYVASHVDDCNDQFSLAVAALALAQAKSPKADQVLSRLDGMARRKDDLKWWSSNPDTIANSDVELTSYVLLAMLENDFIEEPLPVVNWLNGQRNSHGGFGSTQDTVVGLQALTEFAVEVYQQPGDMDIDYSLTKDGERNSIKVTPGQWTKMVYHELPQETNKVYVSGHGSGVSLVQLSYRYNVASEEEKPSFEVTTAVKDAPKNRLKLEFCAEYTPIEAADRGKPSNMALMEIQLPSGFVLTAEDLDKIRSFAGVKLVKAKKEDSMVVIYFDSLSKGHPKCVTVTAARAHAVAMQRPSYVLVYDYYVKERRASQFYQVGSSLCDICDDCGTQCLETR